MLPLLDTILAPLARLMVARGVAFPDLVEHLKGHFVRAAQAQIDGKPTDSRISVMTGLQRRDVARLRSFDVKPAKAHPLTRLVALWQTQRAYADDGRPRALPRMGGQGSFEALAREVLQDVHPRTLLDRLVETRTVRLDDQDNVHLLSAAYVPSTGSDDQLAYLATNAGDHLMAATENVLGRDPAFFERALHLSGLTEDQVMTLEARFRKSQMDLMQQILAEAEAMKAHNGPGAGGVRARFGSYAYFTDRAGDDDA